MICPYCGKENPEDANICDFCGAPLLAIEEPATDTHPLEPDVTIIQTPTQPEVPPAMPSQAPPQPARGIYGNRIWWVIGCVIVFLLLLCCVIASISFYRAVNGLGLFASPTIFAQNTPAPAEVITTIIEPTTAEIVSTSVPTMDVIPTAAPANVIFADDFSDPASGWDRVDEANYFTDYYNGSYRIIINTDMSDSWANPDDNLFTDTRIEVDAAKNAGPDDNDFGVICRYQGMDQFYYAVISSDGYYGVTKVTSESSDLLGSTELQASESINQGSATNHIRFDCVGDTLTLYVNGQQVDKQIDNTYTSGNVGLIAGTYDTPGTDILFDNFYVYQP